MIAPHLGAGQGITSAFVSRTQSTCQPMTVSNCRYRRDTSVVDDHVFPTSRNGAKVGIRPYVLIGLFWATSQRLLKRYKISCHCLITLGHSILELQQLSLRIEHVEKVNNSLPILIA